MISDIMLYANITNDTMVLANMIGALLFSVIMLSVFVLSNIK